MIRIATYSAYTGRILRVGVVPPTDLYLHTPWVAAADGVSDATHHVVAGALTLRQPLAAVWNKMEVTANGVDTAVLAPLPSPCQVNINGFTYNTINGSLEFATTAPGTHYVSVDVMPFLPMRWEIVAT